MIYRNPITPPSFCHRLCRHRVAGLQARWCCPLQARRAFSIRDRERAQNDVPFFLLFARSHEVPCLPASTLNI
jgi:hypothetical protein